MLIEVSGTRLFSVVMVLGEVDVSRGAGLGGDVDGGDLGLVAGPVVAPVSSAETPVPAPVFPRLQS